MTRPGRAATGPPRVYVVSWGWHSHLRPMLPLAYALRAGGCAVTLAVPPSLAPAARASRLPVVVVGLDVDAVPAFRSFVLPDRTRAARERFAAPCPAGPPRALRVFAEAAAAMIDDLVAAARAGRAELIVHEPTAFAGPLAAAALGVPAVRHLHGPDLLLPRPEWVTDVLAPLADQLGVPAPDPLGAATVDPLPAAVGDPGSHARLAVRAGDPVVRAPTAPAPIVVTWGETMAMLDPDLAWGGRVAAALAGVDLPGGPRPVILALPAAQRRLTAPIRGVTVVDNGDLAPIVAGAGVLVSHGGAATVLAALVAGVPQVVVGQLPDHAAFGDRIARAGAGRALAPHEATDEALRRTVADVLDDVRFRAAAAGIARESAARPVPAALVAPLRDLAHLAGGR